MTVEDSEARETSSCAISAQYAIIMHALKKKALLQCAAQWIVTMPLLSASFWKVGRVRLNALVLKTSVPKGTVGSNPTPSAMVSMPVEC